MYLLTFRHRAKVTEQKFRLDQLILEYQYSQHFMKLNVIDEHEHEEEDISVLRLFHFFLWKFGIVINVVQQSGFMFLTTVLIHADLSFFEDVHSLNL